MFHPAVPKWSSLLGALAVRDICCHWRQGAAPLAEAYHATNLLPGVLPAEHVCHCSQGAAPMVEADQTANALTASAVAGVPGVDGGISAETASEVMRAALAAEAEELEDLAQKVGIRRPSCWDWPRKPSSCDL